MHSYTDLIPIVEAAKEKGCTAQALRNAVARGDLNAVRVGRYILLVKDGAYREYRVQETGGRTHTRR